MFHWLTQTEIDRQRYRRQQLGSTQAFARVAQRPVGMHALILHLIRSISARTEGRLPSPFLLSAMYLRPMPHAPEWLADESFPHEYHQHPA